MIAKDSLLNVMQGIYATVTRRTLDGANPEGWIAGEKISVEPRKDFTILLSASNLVPFHLSYHHFSNYNSLLE